MKKDIGIMDPSGKHPNPLNGQSYSAEYKKLAEKWSEYPAYKKKDDIISAFSDDSISVYLVVAGTGSGKTVLMPKFALHATNYEGKIALTFPKRIITLSSAKFAAQTLDVTLGKEIGYMYKGAPKESTSNDSKMIYMTDGTLISLISKDPLLLSFNIVIIDEAHERKVQIDLLLLLIRKIIPERKKLGHPSLKLIIMSATIDTSIFIDYFKKKKIHAKLIEISGQPNYPIEMIYATTIKTDYIDEGVSIINDILKKKTKKREDILFFVTSGQEALNTCKLLSKSFGQDKICIEVFADMADDKKNLLKITDDDAGKVKIYIATNVAESSITLDGIKYVIDAGLELKSSYDPNKNTNMLDKGFISQAQSLQRRGRVGRTEPGICYCLYTKQQFDLFPKFPVADILRADLTADFIKLMNYVYQDNIENTFQSLKDLLFDLIEPPHIDMVASAYRIFKTYKIIDEKEHLTNMGKLMNGFTNYPISMSISLIVSYQHNCAYEMALLMALMELFNYDIMNIFIKRDFSTKQNYDNLLKIGDKTSDHLSLLNIYKKITELDEKQKIEFCRKHYLRNWSFSDPQIKEKAKKIFYQIKNFHSEKPVAQTGGNEQYFNRNGFLKSLFIGHQTQIVKKNKHKYETFYPITQSEVSLTPKSILAESEPNVCIYGDLMAINGRPEIKFLTKIEKDLL